MRALILLAAGAACVCALGVRAAPAEGSEAGRVFPLKRHLLPDISARNYTVRMGTAKPLDKMPPGVDGVEAAWVALRVGQGAFGERRIIAAKSGAQQTRYDRLYVDANGDGRYGSDECYDITRTQGPVRVERDRGTYHIVSVRPIKLVVRRDPPGPEYWIGINVYQRQDGNCFIQYGSLTCAMGRVKLGERDILLAVHDRRFFGRFDTCVAIMARDPETGHPWSGTGCQLLLDVNGNGRFDGIHLSGMGPENRWLTRLVRFGGAYHELKVDPDGRSVRITSCKPEMGMLAFPKNVQSATVIGPEFITKIRGGSKALPLPRGTYVVRQYAYRKGLGPLRASDGSMSSRKFGIRAGETSTFQAGPPLKIDVGFYIQRHGDTGGKSSRQASLSLYAFDCAGRRIDDVAGLGGSSRPAPRFKILDEAGKIVRRGAFEYG